MFSLLFIEEYNNIKCRLVLSLLCLVFSQVIKLNQFKNVKK